MWYSLQHLLWCANLGGHVEELSKNAKLGFYKFIYAPTPTFAHKNKIATISGWNDGSPRDGWPDTNTLFLFYLAALGQYGTVRYFVSPIKGDRGSHPNGTISRQADLRCPTGELEDVAYRRGWSPYWLVPPMHQSQTPHNGCIDHISKWERSYLNCSCILPHCYDRQVRVSFPAQFHRGMKFSSAPLWHSLYMD